MERERERDKERTSKIEKVKVCVCVCVKRCRMCVRVHNAGSSRRQFAHQF